MKLRVKNFVIGVALSLVLSVAFVPQLFAHEGEHETTTTNTGSSEGAKKDPAKTTPSTRKSDSTDKSTSVTHDDSSSSDDTASKKEDNPKNEQRKELAREKLDDKKKALCEERKTAVNKVMSNVVERSKNHFDRITTIYTQTTQFYETKALTVSNYADLIATIETAKTAAAAADQDLTNISTFSCDSDGPKADIQAFRNKRLDKVDAMGAYRDAVKTLVKAVRDAAKAATTTTNTTTGGAN